MWQDQHPIPKAQPFLETAERTDLVLQNSREEKRALRAVMDSHATGMDQHGGHGPAWWAWS